MSTTEADRLMSGREFEPDDDRAMLVLQHLIAFTAAAAAAMLAFVR